MFPEHSGEEQVSGVCQMAKSVPLLYILMIVQSPVLYLCLLPLSVPHLEVGLLGSCAVPGTFGMSQAMLQMRLGVDAAFATSGFE